MATSHVAARSGAPRLSIGHLLTWLVCCCLYLAMIRQLFPRQPTFAELLPIVAAAATDGAAWAGLAVFLSRRTRNVRWHIEPGEWLLAILGARLISFVLLETWLDGMFRTPAFVLSGVTCCLLVLPTLSRRLPTMWRLFFGLLVLVHLLPILDNCFAVFFQANSSTLDTACRFLQRVRTPLTGALVVLFAGLDIRFHGFKKWSWLHWLGLVICLAMLLPVVFAHVL